MLLTALLLTALITSEEPPVEFRCDSLRVDSGPGESSCNGNVVVVRGPVLMCCDRFEAKADTDWQWESFSCEGNVRAQRFNERVWASRASFQFEKSLITLIGEPVLQRGRSLMTGSEVKIDLKNDRAHVAAPRGRIARETDTLNSASDGPKLTTECPIPTRPNF